MHQVAKINFVSNAKKNTMKKRISIGVASSIKDNSMLKVIVGGVVARKDSNQWAAKDKNISPKI